MSEELKWGKYEWESPLVHFFPTCADTKNKVFLKKVKGVWHMDAGFDECTWMFEPMEGVKHFREAKIVAATVWRMR